jgi:hypothetical protein
MGIRERKEEQRYKYKRNKGRKKLFSASSLTG